MSKTKGFGGYFSFRKLITPGIIKFIHVLGLILINLSLLVGFAGGIIAAVTGAYALDLEGGMIAVGILVWIVATILSFFILNILWRMLCEQVILFFSIHEINASLENHLIDVNSNLKKLIELMKEKEEDDEE